MYGARDASQNLETAYRHVLVKHGFKSRAASPCTFDHAHRDIRLVVHGDCFTFLSDDLQCRWVTGITSKYVDVKAHGKLGATEPGDHIKIIVNRCMYWSK